MQKVLRQWPDAATGKLCGEWCYLVEGVENYIKAVKALVEVSKELRECLNCWHINNGVPETTKRTKLMERSWDAIAAVERLEVE